MVNSIFPFMLQPKEYYEHGKENLVCLLKKSLYGLRQAGRCWYQTLSTYLTKIGFEVLYTDECVFIRREKDGLIILAVYIDDSFLFTNSDHLIEWFERLLNKRFELRPLGDIEFLIGIEIVTRSDGTIELSQQNYIQKILKRFGMTDCRGATTPLESGLKKIVHLDTELLNDAKKQEYQEIMGSLIHLVSVSRPDLAFSISFLGQYQSAPNQTAMKLAKRTLQYLKNTEDYCLVYKPSDEDLTAYADADWSGCPKDSKSFSGHIVKIAGTVVSWKSQKQKQVALSTAESELNAVVEATKDVQWTSNFLDEITQTKDTCQPIKIFCDNQSAIKIAKNSVMHNATKHFRRKTHFVRNLIENKVIELEYIPTNQMPADLLTKLVSFDVIQRHAESFGLLKRLKKRKK